MPSEPTVAVCIPAFREEAFIADVVKRTLQHLPNLLVVDDGSGDRTGELAREAGAEVIVHEQNRGKGAAIQTGFKALLERGFDFVVLLDADGQHRPEEIPRFLERAASGEQIVVGRRTEATQKMPFVRRVTNQVMSGLISTVCGQPIPDSQCGFRMIGRSLIPHLFCESRNYEYETEMLLIAARRGFRIGSVPVTTVYGNEVSKINPVRDTIRFFKLLARYAGK